MRRLVRPLAYLGAFGIVLALSKVHASLVADDPYDFTDSSRFVWALGYGVVLGITAYGFGLPDQVRGWRQTVGSAVGAGVVAALALSVVQLVPP